MKQNLAVEISQDSCLGQVVCAIRIYLQIKYMRKLSSPAGATHQKQLLTVGVVVLATMKNAAKIDT